jgi:prevent-host-death family protein
MKRVKIAELKDKLSEHLRAVERGDEIEVTDRNRPIARIVPLPDVDAKPNLIHPTRDFEDVRDRTYIPAGWRIDSTTLLLEERQER